MVQGYLINIIIIYTFTVLVTYINISKFVLVVYIYSFGICYRSLSISYRIVDWGILSTVIYYEMKSNYFLPSKQPKQFTFSDELISMLIAVV